MTVDLDTASLDTQDLLSYFAEILDELKRRGVVRTRNNPVADYSEWLACQGLGLTAAKGNTKGHDAVDSAGRRYQIKGRRLDPANKSKQLSVIRSLDQAQFDYLIAVLLDRDFRVTEAYKIPHAVVGPHARFSSHQNGHILHAQGSLHTAPGVEDIADRLRL